MTTNSLPLAPGTWNADPSHTTVGFTVRHLGLSKVRGRFDGVDSTVVVGDDLASSKVDAKIELGTVATGNSDRDAHLKSSDFFNADTNPQMTFTSTEIRGDGEEYTLLGDLTLNGVTKPVELDVEFFGTSVFPADQSTRAGFSATGSLSRKDFGIEFNMALGGDKVMISDKVALELDVQLVAPSTD
ncbi:YceI family protein [Ilumatobacter nonamiensis]|uniref:YceI family protein n=1 Tax=Ilumatobacter nonamiensis TaxID=467093 RepID=UPI00058BACD8|nr:YceI family protein [Ilumatobacter nonamiensis]